MPPDARITPLFAPRIVADMVELLLQPDAQWFEVEQLLADSPEALRYVQLVRGTPSRPFFFFGQAPSTDFGINEEARYVLLHRLLPYATLLDTRLTSLEQAQQLEREGIDVLDFCTLAQQSGPLYAEAGRAAFNAWVQHKTLLRGSEAVPDTSERLLRPASQRAVDSHLLVAATHARKPAAQPELPASRASWLRRWFARKSA